MAIPKRATVYFEPAVHQALRSRARAKDRSISEFVNDAVKIALAEDQLDSASFQQRSRERRVSFDSFVRNMKRRGRL